MTDHDDGAGTDGSVEGLEALLDYLKRTRAFDFGGYKRSSLGRRIQRRMQVVGVASCADYVDYLEVHPDEFPQLFDMVLINVTSFYRDPIAWNALAARFATMIAAKPNEAIRIWSAGCASGEEAYTLAMMAAEILGLDEFLRRVKIYATDVDEGALATARLATYSAKAVEGVPAPLLEKYFFRNGGSFVFHKDLRRSVIFGRHDLLQDAPISRIDLLSCRNTLMYFNAETQANIVRRLHFALTPEGVLFLGKAEMMLAHSELFTPADLKLRIFARSSRDPKSRERLPPIVSQDPHFDEPKTATGLPALHRVVFETMPLAAIVIEQGGRIALINQRAARMFSLSLKDVGRPFQDLELSYRPAELRSSIDRARDEKRAIQISGVERVLPKGEKVYIDIEISPLVTLDSRVIGTQVAFHDTTAEYRLQRDLKHANAELEAAHEELQSTSEELETTNEELQSTVEELETTNEELQSTNEELETMNEELQSTNEELQTMNEELRQRGEDLNQANAFLGTVLASLRAGVVVLDEEMRVKAWNGKMEDLWGLRASEVEGRHFLNLDIGIPLEELRKPIRACLTEEVDEERVLACTNRRGRALQCRATVSALRGGRTKGVVILFEETE